MEAVLRLLRGESLGVVSSDVRDKVHRLAAWRDEFLTAGTDGQKIRPRALDERRLADAERKVGELTPFSRWTRGGSGARSHDRQTGALVRRRCP
jgi:hypothetical protein